MTISIESIKKYAEGLKADLLKAKDRKEQAVQSVNEADSQVKLLDGALQFAKEAAEPVTGNIEVTTEEDPQQ